ncbi:MAG: Cys-tRNA(Pro) deacylase [Eggerthellaceae bacterium]|nr:Cys-tRNA(Pro) deacylase [Eggerthellaceae bacterium]
MAKHEKDQKSNAMRALDNAGVPYSHIAFECEGAPSGVEVAQMLGQDPDMVFKTLVTVGKSGEHYVFMVPVAEGLDLKKAAAAVDEKSIAMIHQKELFPLTGYVHGGCSPLAQKKQFQTVIDETAQLFDEIMFSGGRIGLQIRMNPEDLAKAIPLKFADITA